MTQYRIIGVDDCFTCDDDNVFASEAEADASLSFLRNVYPGLRAAYVDEIEDEHKVDPPNARFWIPGGMNSEPVRLTLRPGQSVSITSGGQCDEGYSYSCETYVYDEYDQNITHQSSTQACDCDGRLDRYASFSCPIDRLGKGSENYDGHEFAGAIIRYPAWQEEDASICDHEAEKAGY